MYWKRTFVCICAHFVFVWSCERYKWNSLLSEEKHIAGLVLARGGSKGIPLKNIAKIGGHTLLEISLRILKKIDALSSIWVSTDHFAIAEEASKENINIHWRSPESAIDTATSIFAVQEFLKNHPYIDIVCLVQCTSPFLKTQYLNKAINWMNNKADCVFSVSRSYKLRWRETSGKLIPVNFNPMRRPRRQDFTGEFIENGMFYIAKRKLILDGSFQTENATLGAALLISTQQRIAGWVYQ